MTMLHMYVEDFSAYVGLKLDTAICIMSFGINTFWSRSSSINHSMKDARHISLHCATNKEGII